MVPKSKKNLSLTDFDFADDVDFLSDPEYAQKMLDDMVEWSNILDLK